MKGEKIYGIADKAWQVVVGCDPHMPCAPRCWARKTVARVVKCQEAQHPERAEFFQVALTPDGSNWSGEVRLDEAHVTDPLKWGKSALIATGFHGDWGRLAAKDVDRIFAIMALSPKHRFMPLTKCPHDLLAYLNFFTATNADHAQRLIGRGEACAEWMMDVGLSGTQIEAVADSKFWRGLKNVNIGCSVMNQAEADKYREPMRAIAALGWSTHVWYEPAIGAVNWAGWEFLRGMISGGESGANSRPSDPAWHRDTRDWCIENGIPYNFKQWGEFLPPGQVGAPGEGPNDSQIIWSADKPHPIRLDKRVAGRLLDGRTWDGLPAFR